MSESRQKPTLDGLFDLDTRGRDDHAGNALRDRPRSYGRQGRERVIARENHSQGPALLVCDRGAIGSVLTNIVQPEGLPGKELLTAAWQLRRHRQDCFVAIVSG